MPNCSESSIDDTQVEHLSPWKTRKEDGEIFSTVSIQAQIVASETEIIDSINKPKDLFEALFDAIETHEEDALHQEIAKGNEIDKCTDRVGSKIEQINQTKIRD